MIEIRNLQKSFGETEVLKDVNLQIEDGEVYGLVGRSGAGKSTLLRCINKLESYSAGELVVDGIEVSTLDKKQVRTFRKNIGMIFQNFPLLSRKTVYKNIAFPMSCWGYEKSHIDRRVRELAEIVGISDKLDQKPFTLSGGQKQRVSIARALSMNPKILLSDEATSALDPITTTSILDLLKQINEEFGITIVVVTHQMEVIKQVCQKASLLDDGRIALTGRVDEMFVQQPEELRRFTGESNQVGLPRGTNLCLVLQEGDDSKSICYQLATELGVRYQVCGGITDRYRGKQIGSLYINVESADVPRIKSFLGSKSISYRICS